MTCIQWEVVEGNEPMTEETIMYKILSSSLFSTFEETHVELGRKYFKKIFLENFARIYFLIFAKLAHENTKLSFFGENSILTKISQKITDFFVKCNSCVITLLLRNFCKQKLSPTGGIGNSFYFSTLTPLKSIQDTNIMRTWHPQPSYSYIGWMSLRFLYLWTVYCNLMF